MKSIYIFLLYSFVAFAGAAQPKGGCELLGHVTDDSGEHIAFASVVLKGTQIATTTDGHGHFILSELPEGNYVVLASCVGYLPAEEKIVLSPGKTNDITIVLHEKTQELNAVVVSANRRETSRKETPVVVSVIDPKTFEITNAGNMAEGLSFMPGLRVENNCQNCGFQQVRINGLDGQYSQILIDSRPIVSALTGVYGIEQFPVGMIDRVEVLRGGGSALFGSNAIAGVVNVITKEPVRNSGLLSHNFNLIGGKAAENVTALNASLVTNDYKAGMYIFGNINHRNPYDADGDGYTELSKLRSTTLGFRGYYRPNSWSKLTLEYHNIDEYRRGGDSLDLPPHRANIAEQTEHDINGGGFKYDMHSADYKHKVSVYGSTQYTMRNSYYGAGQDPNAYGITSGLTADAGTQYSYDFEKLWFMPANFIVGAEYYYDHLDDNMPGYARHTDQTAQTGSVFLQNEWKNPMFSILLGARLDKHNMIKDPIFSPRINFRYNPLEDIGLRVSYSEGFRAPQVFSEDLHILATGGKVILVELDPDLKPERSRSFSASADLYHTFGIIQTNLLVEGFYTHLTDVFTDVYKGTDSQGNIIHEKTNTSGATVAGMNLEAKAAFGKNYQLQAGFTYQRSQYDELPEPWSKTVAPTKNMFRTPDWYGYFTGTLMPLKNFTAALSGVYTGSMLVQHNAGYVPQDGNVKTPAFFDANIKLSYLFKLGGSLALELSAGVKNVFDSYQRDFDKGPDRDAGYMYGPIYPRSYFAGLKIML